MQVTEDSRLDRGDPVARAFDRHEGAVDVGECLLECAEVLAGCCAHGQDGGALRSDGADGALAGIEGLAQPLARLVEVGCGVVKVAGVP